MRARQAPFAKSQEEEEAAGDVANLALLRDLQERVGQERGWREEQESVRREPLTKLVAATAMLSHEVEDTLPGLLAAHEQVPPCVPPLGIHTYIYIYIYICIYI